MTTPTFHLEGIVKIRDEIQDFEGPLNLILLLLSKNKIEIRDIQISLILDQYLEHIAKMQEMDLEVASEFVQMASQLLYIKTRTLLSSQEEQSELDILISSLEQLKSRDTYSRIKAVTGQLAAAYETGALLGVKRPEPIKLSKEYGYRHTEAELLTALLSVLNRGVRAPEEEGYIKKAIPKRIVFGVKEKSRQIINWLICEGDLPLNFLFKKSGTRTELVATFISILELCATGNLLIGSGESGELMVSFTGGLETERIIESISEEGSLTNGD